MASVTKTERKRKVLDETGQPLLSSKGQPVWVGTGEYFWLVTYRDNSASRREVKRRFQKKADAEVFLKGVTADLVYNRYVSPGAGRISLRNYTETVWIDAQRHRESTVEQVGRHLRNHVFPAFGDMRLDAIRTSDVRRFVTKLSETLAPSTVSVIYQYTSSIFKTAVEDKILAESPFKGVHRPPVPSKMVQPPTTETVQRIVNACPSRYRALVALTATTGIRQSEAFGITLDRLDLSNGTVRIDRQLASVNGAAPKFSPPKTKASFRKIPLPDIAVLELRQHLETWMPGPMGIVFTNMRGDRLRRAAFGNAWKKILTSADVPHTTFHGLRHYYASLLIQSGESVKTVQSLLGHASAVETLDTYGHLWPGSDARARSAVDSVLSFEILEPSLSS
jgi:integrase